MFDEIKKAADEIERMELEVERRKEEIVKKLDDKHGVIGIRKSGGDYMAQIYDIQRLKDIADDEVINVAIRDDEYYPYELELIAEGVTFFKLLTKKDYEFYMEDQSVVYVEGYSPEEARARLTEYERGLRN